MTEERIEAIQTRWSLIRNAHLAGQPESASEARRLLVLRYAPAIRRYLGGIVRNDEDDDELSQDVMLRLMRGDFGGAGPPQSISRSAEDGTTKYGALIPAKVRSTQNSRSGAGSDR